MFFPSFFVVFHIPNLFLPTSEIKFEKMVCKTLLIFKSFFSYKIFTWTWSISWTESGIIFFSGAANIELPNHEKPVRMGPANTQWQSPQRPSLLLPDWDAIQWTQTGRPKCQMPGLPVWYLHIPTVKMSFQFLVRTVWLQLQLSLSSFGTSTRHCSLTQGFPAEVSSLCSPFSYMGAENTYKGCIPPFLAWLLPAELLCETWDGIGALGGDKEKPKSCLSDHLTIIFLIYVDLFWIFYTEII